MPTPAPLSLSRRHFLGSTCCAAVGATGLLSALAQLRLLGAVAPAGPARAAAEPEFKALVCLFLQGGNDGNNLIIPYDTSGYNTYVQARANLALPRPGLLPIAPRTSDGRSFALHPAVPELRTLFDAGRAALLANVGTLVVPTSKAQYQAASVPLPFQLFSHNDQEVQWQTSLPDRRNTSGWGGRLADLVDAFNTNPAVSMSISLAGINTFQVGSEVTQYAVTPAGAINFQGGAAPAGTGDAVRFAAHKELYNRPQSSLLDAAFSGLTSGSIATAEWVSQALASSPQPATTFPATSAGSQLRMVARFIAAAPALRLRRQLFFVQLGGWDTHAGQVEPTNRAAGAHAQLLAQTSQAIDAFYRATVELGVGDRVTTFTASDFGRTYTSNGAGSDHGWGNHQLIVGGAVRGGDIYGRMPVLTVDGSDDIGRGRWIPTTSVDEYAATLATWFGVSAGDLPAVLPNLGRFARANLGFLPA
jgi:uncharacterized protein (DUF1501 family)